MAQTLSCGGPGRPVLLWPAEMLWLCHKSTRPGQVQRRTWLKDPLCQFGDPSPGDQRPPDPCASPEGAVSANIALPSFSLRLFPLFYIPLILSFSQASPQNCLASGAPPWFHGAHHSFSDCQGYSRLCVLSPGHFPFTSQPRTTLASCAAPHGVGARRDHCRAQGPAVPEQCC